MTKKKKFQKSNHFRNLIGIIMIVILIFISIGVIYVVQIVKDLPRANQFGSQQISQSTKIYDRTGEILLYEIHGEEKRTIIPFEEIPDYLKWATITAENANFYNEPAFNWKAIIRALIVNLKAGRISQGGSTISQQLAKNLFLTPERTISRKIKELVLAIELESQYTKNEIFALYLNQIPYGSNAYGVEAASQIYFNKSAKELDITESAILASLPRAPTYYSPWGSHKEELFERQSYVLNRMRELGYITAEELLQAEIASQEINFAPQISGTIKAPHFTLTVRDYLINNYGKDVVERGGLKVITTLNWDFQQLAEKVVAQGAQRNEELYNGTNAALVAQDPKTGQILALVGSRDYFDVNNEGNFNVVTQGFRQPGSALKPFAYLTAFEKGFSPKTIVFDVPTEFDTTGDPAKSYQPSNFDDRFRGPVSLEQGLSQSINVPSVKVLYLAGIDNFLEKVHKFGITTLKERSRYGLSLILGGGEVKLIDLINAYSVFAREGIKHKQTFILKVEDVNGEILESYNNESIRVEEPQNIRLINQIISDEQLRGGLFQSSLHLTKFPDYEVALKTGTTNDYRDAWAIGYTPFLVVGVWAGNNNNTPMHQQGSSILAAVPIWSAFLKEAIQQYQPETFNKPEPIIGFNKPMINGEFIFKPLIEGKVKPQIHSILYYIFKNDPLGVAPEFPSRDSQFENWEKGILEWGKDNIADFLQYNFPIPQPLVFEDLISNGNAVDQKKENITIQYNNLKNGDFIKQPLTIRADITAKQGLSKIEFYFNRQLLSRFYVDGNTYQFNYTIGGGLKSQNLINLKVFDRFGRRAESSLILFH